MITDNNKIGYFRFKVRDKYMLVNSFRLLKAVNKPISCIVLIVPGTLIKQSDKNYASGVDIFTNYIKLTLINIPCSLIQCVDKVERTWFIGYISGINPTLASGSNVVIKTHITCIGHLMLLMYSPVRDFTSMPASGLDTSKLDALSSSSLLLAQYYQSTPMLYKDLCVSANQTTKQDIATLLCRINQAINTRLAKAAGITDDSVGSKLLNYILSKTYMAKTLRYTDQLLPSGNPLIDSINKDYLRGTLQSTIWLGIIAVVNDKLLQLVPPSILEINSNLHPKFKIIPAYPINSKQMLEIKSSDLLGISLRTNPILQLAVPDMLAVNLLKMSQYQSTDVSNDSKLAASGIYGIFPLQRKKLYQEKSYNVKVKVIDAPTWALRLCFNCLKPETKPATKSDSLASLQTAQPTAVGLFESIKTIINSYAKTLFYFMYASGKKVNILMVYNNNNVNIDKYLGYPVAINLSNIANANKGLDDWRNLPKLYCMINKISYAYNIGSVVDYSDSTFHITVDAVQVIALGSRFSSIYTLPLDGTIYLSK